MKNADVSVRKRLPTLSFTEHGTVTIPTGTPYCPATQASTSCTCVSRLPAVTFPIATTVPSNSSLPSEKVCFRSLSFLPAAVYPAVHCSAVCSLRPSRTFPEWFPPWPLRQLKIVVRFCKLLLPGLPPPCLRRCLFQKRKPGIRAVCWKSLTSPASERQIGQLKTWLA